MLPALSAQPNPQIMYTSSTGYPDSDVLWRLVQRGRTGGDPSLCYMEYSAESADDPDAHVVANPSLGYLFDEETIERERATLAPVDYDRERLGLWSETGGDRVISGPVWDECLDVASEVSAPLFALDVAPSRAWAAIGVAGRNASDLVHVEVTGRGGAVDHRRGTEWVVPRLLELQGTFPDLRVSVAASSAAEGLKSELEAVGIPVDVVSGRDVQAACGLFFDYASTKRLAHLGQPALDSAVAAAKKRVEDGETAWVWGRKRSTADITPLYAVTLALWAVVAGSNMNLHPINNVW
jgi:hypothetical protein